MLGLQRLVIADHERVFVYHNRRFQRVLTAGVYRFFNPLGRYTFVRFDTSEPKVELADVDSLRHTHGALIASLFHEVETGPDTVALVFEGDQLLTVYGPGNRALYWREPKNIRIRELDIREDFAVPTDVMRQISRTGKSMLWVEVPKQHTGLLYVDGILQEPLGHGAYGFWKFGRNLQAKIVDLRWQAMEVNGQEILTKDRVSLRINLSANWRVTDATLAMSKLHDFSEYLYRELQFGVRQAIASKTLDSLLGDKGGLERQVFETVCERLKDTGLQLSSVGIKDIILPGEMKTILNQVVEAEKAAQANVIKRREETAATRSALNTAKLMDENPTLMRLKELEDVGAYYKKYLILACRDFLWQDTLTKTGWLPVEVK